MILRQKQNNYMIEFYIPFQTHSETCVFMQEQITVILNS